MHYELTPYSIHELGERQNQEDALFPAFGKSTPNDRLFILCDGMGGHEKGEVASATVCEVMSQTILSRWNQDEALSDALLLQAIEDAYEALDAKDNSEMKKMGTTMTFLCFHSEGATVAHIGDSRVYQLRPAKGDVPASIVFKTRDHSLVNDLIKIGEITEEEAKTHPQKNVITRAMQPCQEHRSKADIKHLTDIQPGDYFYMCSDGMLEQTSDENILYIITKANISDERKVEMLRDVTSDNKDNHTAHIIKINNVDVGSSIGYDEMDDTINVETDAAAPIGETNKKHKSSLLLILLVFIACGLAGYFLFNKKSSSIPPISKDNQQQETMAPQAMPHVKEITIESNVSSGGHGDSNETDKPDIKTENGEQTEIKDTAHRESLNNDKLDQVSKFIKGKQKDTNEVRKDTV